MKIKLSIELSERNEYGVERVIAEQTRIVEDTAREIMKNFDQIFFGAWQKIMLKIEAKANEEEKEEFNKNAGESPKSAP